MLQTVMAADNQKADFDNNSFFASSLNNHDGAYELEDDEMLQMNQSLGCWYQPNDANEAEAEETAVETKKKNVKRPKDAKMDNATLKRVLEAENSMGSKESLPLLLNSDIDK